jgi:beta-lactamase class A
MKSKIVLSALAAIFLGMSGPAQAQEANLKVLHHKTANQLRQIVERTRGVMGVVALDLTSGERFAINEDLVFPQASAIKIAILMEVCKQAQAGKFKFTDRRRIEQQDKAGGSGVLLHLGDGTVELTIEDLCVLMIMVSDNTATNLLIDLVGMANINQTLASLGLKHTRLQRHMLDTGASWRGEENISTPAEAARIMELLFKGEFLSREVCDHILSILRKTRTGGIKSGLPTDVPVAFKPGGIAGVKTEWAIVLLQNRPYVVIVMENYGLEDDAADAMKEISRTLHDYFSRLARATAHGTYVEPPR